MPSLSVLKMLFFRTESHKMLVRIANREDPDQTAIWVCTVCPCLFGRQLVFKILEQLPTGVQNFRTITNIDPNAYWVAKLYFLYIHDFFLCFNWHFSVQFNLMLYLFYEDSKQP